VTDYSVVIPAYNAAATIAAGIASLQQQTVLPREIIVVDDGSTDDTAAVAASLGPGVRVVRQPNRGPGAAMTHGLELVATPLVGFLDADDVWLPHKAAVQLEWLSREPGLDGVFALSSFFTEHPSDRAADSAEGLGRTYLMIRTERARLVGPVVDPPGRRGEMIDWIARARELNLVFKTIPEVLALRRMRPGSLSAARGSADRGYVHVVKSALDRRRAREGSGADAPAKPRP
jgi:glycosyltransferase involved in cell wall biosynthesis